MRSDYLRITVVSTVVALVVLPNDVAPDEVRSTRAAESKAFLAALEGTMLRRGNFVDVAISPNSAVLAACALTDKNNCCTYLFDVQSGRELAEIPGYGDGGLAFSSDGKLLALGRKNRQETVSLWQVPSGVQILQRSINSDRTGHEGAWDVALSSDGKYLAVGCVDSTIRVLDVTSGNETVRLIGSPSTVCCVAFSPDGKYLASGSHRRSIRLWSVANWSEAASWYDASVTSLAFTSTGRFLVSGSYDGTVRVWEMPSRRQVRLLGGGRGAIRSIALTGDGRTIASLAADGTVQLWEMATGRERGRINSSPNQTSQSAQAAAVSNDGRWIAICRPPGLDLQRLRDETETGPASVQPISMERLWGELSDSDAMAAYRAIATMANRSETIAFIRARWRPESGFDSSQFRQWIRDLGASQFETRERATAELAKVADIIERELRSELTGRPGPEAEHRIGQILEQVQQGIPASDRLRWLRVVEMLERIGSREAQEFLQELSKEALDPALSSEARESLVRLRAAN